MDIFNIRIINQIRERNVYIGNIIIDKNKTIYGIGIERNYDNDIKFLGKIIDKEIYLEIQSETEKISILASQSDTFPKKSLDISNYYSGFSLDQHEDLLFIEITNIKDIEQKILNEKNKTLSLKKKDEY